MRGFFPNMRVEELDAGHWGMFPNTALDSVAEFYGFNSTRGEAQRVP